MNTLVVNPEAKQRGAQRGRLAQNLEHEHWDFGERVERREETGLTR